MPSPTEQDKTRAEVECGSGTFQLRRQRRFRAHGFSKVRKKTLSPNMQTSEGHGFTQWKSIVSEAQNSIRAVDHAFNEGINEGDWRTSKKQMKETHLLHKARVGLNAPLCSKSDPLMRPECIYICLT